MSEEASIGGAASWRAYGLIIVLGSIAALGGMAVHPEGGGKVMDMVRNLVANGGFGSAVHAFLIGVYLLLLLGFTGFAEWLGDRRLLVRAGLIAYIAGVFAAAAAAIASAFVGRTLAFNYANAKPEEVNSVVSAFRVSGAFNYAWGRMWAIAISAAILLWSIELLRKQGLAKPVAYFGLLVGFVGFVGIPSGLIPLTVMALVGVILGQTIWSIAVGAILIRADRS